MIKRVFVAMAALVLSACANAAPGGENDAVDFGPNMPPRESTDLATGCNGPFTGEFCTPSIYVSTKGDDLNYGNAAKAPVRSVSVAVARAVLCAGDPCPILVAGGTYSGQVVLKSGVTLTGGYTEDFLTRDPTAHEVILTSDDSRTVVVDGNVKATTVDGVTINGATLALADGRSSYAVWANATRGVVRFVNTRIHAGRGADGRPGAPGSEIACAIAPAAGGAAGDCMALPGAMGTAGGDPVGGGGPGAGGTSTCPDACPAAGTDGITNGGTGMPGGNGRNGMAGLAPMGGLGSFVGGMWANTLGHAGERGLHGAGGGGGGAGGTKRIRNCFGCGTIVGGHGGDGAPGGCGGGGGGPGGPAGGAFAFLLNDADLTVDGGEITGGTAGNGGAGGDGRDGQPGGNNVMNGIQPGGHLKCGANDYYSGAGGPGGVGGKGGAGGGGGGGAGGIAITIARLGTSTLTRLHTVDVKPGVAGTGGTGGASAGNPGGAGPMGVMAVEQAF